MSQGTESILASLQSPFVVEGAPNVFLETIKRGENDTFGPDSATTTVVLRLYEAFGGHARAQLRIASHLTISKAFITNLLEDENENEELNIFRFDNTETPGSLVKLNFRGFEVKTVKLVIAAANDTK